MTFSISRSVKSVIFVVNSLNLGQAGLVGIKLCECLKILEQTSRDSNQVTNQLIRLFLLTKIICQSYSFFLMY